MIDHAGPEQGTIDTESSDSLSPSTDAELLVALQRQNPDRALQAFLRLATDLQEVQSIPSTTFSELLKLLRPEIFFERFKAIHQELSLAAVQRLKLSPTEKLFAEYLRTATNVIGIRRRAGCPLGLTDYRFLLDCARALGDGPMADQLWKELRNDQVNPDTTCYNSYMAAKCWSGLFHANMRQKIRVHRVFTPGNEFKVWLNRMGQGPSRERILGLYDEMNNEGVFADEKTYGLLIIAMAREADTLGMKSVLKHVWNVDVDKTLELEDQYLEPVTDHPEDSPLRPTSDLLFAVAHSYAINSDIPRALRLVDYISRSYRLVVPQVVWEELFAWTYALSIFRDWKRRSDKTATGRLPYGSVSSLWNTMTESPYHIQPTVPMYNRYIMNLFQRQRLGTARMRMHEGHRLARLGANNYLRAMQKLAAAELLEAHGVELPMTELSVEHLRREVEYARLIRARDIDMVRRWVRNLLRMTTYLRGNERWEKKELQDEIFQWRHYLPPRTKYIASTGKLSLKLARGESGAASRVIFKTTRAERGLVRKVYPTVVSTLAPRRFRRLALTKNQTK